MRKNIKKIRVDSNLVDKNNKKLKKIIAKKSHFRQSEICEILQKVKYNNVQIYSHFIHIETLEKSGINFNAPIFVERAECLSLSYAKSLYLAGKIWPFQLVIIYADTPIEEYKKLLKNAHFINAKDIDSNLKTELQRANINYKTQKEFPHNLGLITGEFVDNLIAEKTTKKFKNYCLETTYYFSTFNLTITKTYYMGKYIFINEKLPKNIDLIIINQLKTNFFDYFHILNNKNVRSMRGKNYYFNSNIKPQKIEIMRVKNENYLICKYKTSGEFWFYFSEENLCVNAPNLITTCDKISQLFSIKLICGDEISEFYFNNYLPNQIIREKLLGIEPPNLYLYRHNLTFRQVITLHKQKKISAKLAYITLQKLAFSKQNNLLIVNKTEFKNLKFEIFLAGKTRSITVTQTNKKLLKIDNVIYAGTSAISIENLKKYDNFEFEI